MSSHCPCCDRALEQRAERGGLVVMSEPWRLFWRGQALEGLPPMPTRFLFMLLRSPDGRVASSSLDMFLCATTGGKTLSVHMHRLRAWLKASGLPFVIQTLHGWGYQLEASRP